MKLALLFFAIILIIALSLYRKRKSRLLACVVAGCSIATMTLAVLFFISLGKPRIVVPAARELGRAMAADFPHGGNVLVVGVIPPSISFKSKWDSYGMRDLRDGIRGSSLRLIVPDANMPEISNDWKSIYHVTQDGDDYFGPYLKAFTNVVAVVSLMGYPGLAPDELPQPLPPFYVLGTRSDLTNTVWLNSGVVKKILLPSPAHL